MRIYKEIHTSYFERIVKSDIIYADFREKVKRGKLLVQHFDFDLEYTKGPDNVAMDGFNRLCPEKEHTELTDEMKKENFL